MHRLSLFLLAVLALPAQAEIKLPKVFTPHMVLQRGMAVPVWGTAAPGEKVEVSFRNQSKTVEAGADGKWSLKLDPLLAGGPDVLSVGKIKLFDVLVGEVWVGSGQSNMDMPVTSYTANDPHLAKLATGTYPKLRLMLKNGDAKWEQATPETIATFSALLFSFGQPLQAKLDIPVGLMVGAVGGTPSGFWLTDDMLKADEACQAEIKREAATYDFAGLTAKYKEDKAKYDKDVEIWKPLAEAAKKEGKPLPPGPRRPNPAGKPGEANFGKVGSLFENFIRPYVGYAIKGVLWDQGESKTNIACLDQYTLMGALIKGWRREWGHGDFPFLYVQKPSGGGPAWDYENPVTEKANKFMPLPKALPPLPDPAYSQEMHLKIMSYPATFMVTSTDLGAGTHPTNKSGYGERASQVALSAAYGDKHEIYGPLYAGHKIEGNKVRISYTHVGQGLAPRHSETIQGFEVAGADKVFVWADAVIQNDSIIVSAKQVQRPVAVRYAWSGQFPWANLFNKDGLPAQPFRTDAW